MLDVLPLAFSALRNLSFIIDTKISIKQCYNHTTIREYLFIFHDLNTKTKHTLLLQ